MKTKVFKLVLFVICLFTVTNTYSQISEQKKIRYFFNDYSNYGISLYYHLWLISSDGDNTGYYVLLHDTKNKYTYDSNHLLKYHKSEEEEDHISSTRPDTELELDFYDRNNNHYNSAFDNPKNKNLFIYGIYKQIGNNFEFYTSLQNSPHIAKLHNEKLDYMVNNFVPFMIEITENYYDEDLWLNAILDSTNLFITTEICNKFRNEKEQLEKLEEQYKQDSIQHNENDKWRNYVEPYIPEQEHQNHLSKTDAEIINKQFIDAKNLWTNKTEAYFVADVPNQGLRFDISKHFLFHGNKVVLHTEWKQLVKGTWYSYSKNSVLRGTWKKIAPNKIVITFKNGKKLTCTYRKTKDQYMHNKLIISGIGTAIEGYPSVNRRRTDLWDNHDTLLSEYFGISY